LFIVLDGRSVLPLVERYRSRRCKESNEDCFGFGYTTSIGEWGQVVVLFLGYFVVHRCVRQVLMTLLLLADSNELRDFSVILRALIILFPAQGEDIISLAEPDQDEKKPAGTDGGNSQSQTGFVEEPSKQAPDDRCGVSPTNAAQPRSDWFPSGIPPSASRDNLVSRSGMSRSASAASVDGDGPSRRVGNDDPARSVSSFSRGARGIKRAPEFRPRTMMFAAAEDLCSGAVGRKPGFVFKLSNWLLAMMFALRMVFKQVGPTTKSNFHAALSICAVFRILSAASLSLNVLFADTIRAFALVDNPTDEQGWGILLSTLLLAMWGFFGIWSLHMLGHDMSTFFSGVIVSSIMVGLLSQAVIKDVFGAVSLVLNRPFRVGDFVTVAIGSKSFEGNVLSIGFRCTVLRLLNCGQTLYVPNSELSHASIINWYEIPERRLVEWLYIDPQTPRDNVEAFREALRIRTSAVQDAWFTSATLWEVGADALKIKFIFRCICREPMPRSTNDLHKRVRNAVNLGVLDAARDAAVKFVPPLASRVFLTAPTRDGEVGGFAVDRTV